MANFNSSFWYQLYVNENKDLSLWGTKLYNENRTGAVYFNRTQTDKQTNRWQLFPVNSTTYVLRTQEGGPNAFMGAAFISTEDTPGQTRPIMINGTFSDDSVYWTISPWGDGTFYMTNGANGTAWHLKKKSNGLLCMDSNTTEIQPGQRFSFTAEQNDEIKDQPRFSTVSLPSSTVTSAASISQTSAPTSAPTSEPTSTSPGNSGSTGSSSGLSTGAKAGIGVGVGGAALIFLILLGLWFWKKKKAKSSLPSELPYKYDQHPMHQELAHEAGAVKYEMSTDNTAQKYEMPATQEPQSPAELPSNTAERNAP